MYRNAWSAKQRKEMIKEARDTEFDIIIIGGGITGAGIAREAALRGHSFCLLEKSDFAFGTSSRSSKLFHGGLRYLSSGEFGLVRESTTERNWIMHHFPNLVRPLGFMFCSYEKGKDSPFKIFLAVKLYDILSNYFSTFKNYRRARIFTPDFIEEFEPAVALETPELGKLKMAGFYYDTNCDDSRVTLEIIKESVARSGNTSVALNYCKAKAFEGGSSNPSVTVLDSEENKTFTVRGKVIVSATGIWTDELLLEGRYSEEKIYPTKGVHIVVPNERLGNRNAFGIRSLDDGRFFFILRRGDTSVIGTTDTAYYPESKNLDEPWCKKEDCDYLLSTVNRLFPHARLTYDDIIGTWAGIRPLIKPEGAKHESDVSRTHEIFETGDGIIAIAGGKSTTHRRMAEDLLFYLYENEKLNTPEKKEYLKKNFSMQPFTVGLNRQEFDRIVTEEHLAEHSWPCQLQYLHQQFGIQGIEILRRIKKSPKRGEPLLAGYPHCEAEIEYILEHESAPHLSDILCRRTEAQWNIWHYLQKDLAEKVAGVMGRYYRWTAAKKKKEIKTYLDYVKKTVEFIP